jgi:hypothetical protein
MTICPLGDAFCEPVRSFVERFRGEFEARIATAEAPPPRKLPILPVRSDGELFGL